MQHTHRPWLRPNLIRCLLTTGYVSLIMAGCAGSLPPDTTIHQDPRSAVFLQNVSDRSYRAAHPIKLEETTVARVLRGVHTRDTTGAMDALFPSAPKDTRAFSDDDIAVLTPYLTAALAQAAPNQRVGFRLYYTPDIPTLSQNVGAAVGSSEPPLAGHIVETTAGHLFAHGLSLHVTLTLYRHRPEKADTINMANRRLPDPNGLRRRDVVFLPENVVRPETYKQSGWFDESDDRTLVIDYQLLAKLSASPPEPARTPTSPAAQPVPPPPAPVAQPLQSPPAMPEPAGKSDPALQALKEELKALQKKVDEQNAELQKLKKPLKKKPAAPSKDSPP